MKHEGYSYVIVIKRSGQLTNRMVKIWSVKYVTRNLVKQWAIKWLEWTNIEVF